MLLRRSNFDLLVAVLAVGTANAACQIDDVYVYRGGNRARTPDAGSDVTTPPPPPPEGPAFESASDVLAFFEGKVLEMQGDQIPSHPNGYDENVNFGQATQCIHLVRMTIGSGQFSVETELGTLANAPSSGDRGECDRATPSGTDLAFNTTAVLVENVKDGGDCFDLTLTYAGFGQEGRGSFASDRATVSLELFLRDQATGHRCADGPIGAHTVTLNQEPFTGDAVQIYTVNE